MEPTPPHYYHYTTMASWEAISREGVIRAGKDGLVYLSPELYQTAEEATERLSILGKALECVIWLDRTLVQGRLMATPVKPIVDAVTQRVVREGGGAEIRHQGDLPLPVRVAFLVR
ncbi:MAG: hypothetical protein HY532_04480 [Chloroflexi bacterium]|nr:hypothetical protein [Chloroflexota bacterium]